jgi:hypothetical protein
MMHINKRQASGQGMLLRVGRNATAITIFETRCQPCRIAVRADIRKSINSIEKWPQRGNVSSSCGNQSDVQQNRILLPDGVSQRIPEHSRLTTVAGKHSCGLRFPYTIGRCKLTGLPEQRP